MRWSNHQFYLRRGKHPNKLLQNVFNKYGEEDLVFEVILQCTADELNTKEQSFLDIYVGQPLCMNFSPLASNPVGHIDLTGMKRDAGIGLKISKALKGRNLSESHIKALIDSHPAKTVIAMNSQGSLLEFISIREAAAYFNCIKGAIVSCIRKGTFTERPSAKLYSWKFQHKDS
jgi:hypothetical protein